MARTVVLLPHPDSRTNPSVSPFLTVNEISSTARTEPTCRWRKPLVRGKCILRCSTRRSSVGPPFLGTSCIGRVEIAMVQRDAPGRRVDSGDLARQPGHNLVL